ncbi:uncharacterized protein KGF55_001580 [Candida pseudojiufengensis]|uniref:uncharacterized protein n=1 Tax=Candida pseudojiufengensis TaxID=497109 RepID=UPI0022245946|nr:uncharacterized protein KGF55_001580 [Candida pseudojiufengensis]KAI5965359.1 hypothetical protein KGF55_001580 [Candida pseudojiufengensis]
MSTQSNESSTQSNETATQSTHVKIQEPMATENSDNTSDQELQPETIGTPESGTTLGHHSPHYTDDKSTEEAVAIGIFKSVVATLKSSIVKDVLQALQNPDTIKNQPQKSPTIKMGHDSNSTINTKNDQTNIIDSNTSTISTNNHDVTSTNLTNNNTSTTSTNYVIDINQTFKQMKNQQDDKKWAALLASTIDAIDFRHLENYPPLNDALYEKRICKYYQYLQTKENKSPDEQDLIKRQANYPSDKVNDLYQFYRFLQILLIFKYQQSVPDFKLNNQIRTAATGVKDKDLDEIVHLSIKNNILNYQSVIEYKSLIEYVRTAIKEPASENLLEQVQYKLKDPSYKSLTNIKYQIIHYIRSDHARRITKLEWIHMLSSIFKTFPTYIKKAIDILDNQVKTDFYLILNHESKVDELNELIDIDFETQWLYMDKALTKILTIEKED